MDTVLHQRLPKAPWLDPAVWRLPGVQPLDPKDWLIRDETFADQMALRDALIDARTCDVHGLLPQGVAAAHECLGLFLDVLSDDPAYRIGAETVTRPDGCVVPIDRDRPLLTCGRLTQSDICVMQAGPDGHVLTGAILCFPAAWTLAEKLGKPLTAIHTPVPEYDAQVARRVQRLFDAVRCDQPLWRANAILHDDPTLFAPRLEGATYSDCDRDAARFVRSERQALRRLPETDAVLFTIHTYMIPLANLTADQRAALPGAQLKTGE